MKLPFVKLSALAAEERETVQLLMFQHLLCS